VKLEVVLGVVMVLQSTSSTNTKESTVQDKHTHLDEEDDDWND
jgi:hypothetical protein